MDESLRVRLRDKRLKDLGEISYGRIEIAPFSVHRFGIEFGLIVRAPEDDEDLLTVTMEPGNYMAFFEPWDSGEYDT
jgi:hypothetical protein